MSQAPQTPCATSVDACQGTTRCRAWASWAQERGVAAGLWALGLVAVVPLPAPATEIGGSIFVCVDAQGRRITSDRPIPECLAREQRELSSAGTTLRIIPASLTAEERAREEAKAAQEAAQKARLQEERRRDRALLARYQSASQHEAERTKQLQVVLSTQESIRQRIRDLQKQREEWLTELEFYKSNPSHTPAWLKRNLQDNQEQQAGQQRLLAAQSAEMTRIHARFDDELARLKRLWSPSPAGER